MAIKLLENPDERNDPPRPLIEHLIALRGMLVFAAIWWAIGVVVAGCFAPWILEILQAPARQYADMSNDAFSLQVVGMTASFDVWMSTALWGGTFLSFPFIVFAFLRFVFPALTRREKVILLSGLGSSTVLFMIGSVLAYYQTLPLVVAVFRQIGSWMDIDQTIITIDTYIPLVLKLIAAFGLVFQIPLILFVLGLFGLVTSKGLREKRRIAIVISFVLSMVLTPPDPMSQIIMAVPLCLLYEVAVWAIWLKERATREKGG